jgi:ankyrin repeat protein
MKTEADVEAALERLPEGIKERYDALLQRVEGLSEANQEFVMNTLMWLYCAQAHLEVLQLIHAVSRTRKSTTKVPTKDELLSACSGLVDWDEGLNVFRPSHPSVLDYFGKMDGFYLMAHTTVFTTCLRVCSGTSTRAGDPLHRYSTVYWPAHLYYIGGDIEDLAIRSELRSFVFCEDILASKSNSTLNLLTKIFKPDRKGLLISPAFIKWIGEVGKLCEQLGQSDGSRARLLASMRGELTPIFLASTFGFLWMFQLFHAACPKLDLVTKNRNGNTAFKLACMYGSASIVEYLLDRKLQPGAGDLVCAAENGHALVVKILLTRTTIDVNVTHGWWTPRTPLVVAAMNGHAAVVEVLLGASKIVADFAPSKGVTPLIQAATYGRDDVVTTLIERGHVDVNKSDGKGNTALMTAIRHGHVNVVEILLSLPDIVVQSQNTNGDTYLSNAIISGNQEIVQTLLAHEATDINFQDTTLGRTPILWAARNGNLSLAELLLTRPGIRVDTPDLDGRTALSWAAGEGFEKIAELLSSRSDVSINSQCKLGRTPLSYAASYGAVEAIKVLLGLPGIEPGERDRDGWTPLSWAAQGLQTYTGHGLGRQLISLGLATGFLKVTREDGGDVNEKFPAIDQCRLNTLSFLLTQGRIDINETDNHGRTPLSWAAGGGCAQAVQFLLSHQNIDADIADVDGHKPMWHAQNSGCPAIAKLLSTDSQFLSPEEMQDVTQTTRMNFDFEICW